MKHLSFLTLIFYCSLSFGQVNLDSLKLEVPDLPAIPDSVKLQWMKVDSIRMTFNASADSLRNKFNQSVGLIDSLASQINNTMDSLENLKLPTTKLTAKIDSLYAIRKQKVDELNNKLADIKAKTTGKLSKIEMTPGMEGPVGEFTGKINGMTLKDGQFPDIPGLEIPGYSLPEIKDMGDLTSGLQQTMNIPDVAGIETPAGDLQQVSGQIKGVSEDVKNIAGGNLDEVKNIPQAIEQQAANIEGVKELQKQSEAVDQYKEEISDLNDPEALKKQAADLVKKEAMNHFAGKEEQLRAAMDKISKYKQKYSSVSSLRDLPKRPPNPMKGKPFVERLVPGLYLQYQQKNAWLLDVNPYAGYRISGRFMPGMGWNQRFAYDNRENDFIPSKRIFGPRIFLDTRLGKGFIAHLEAECMNTFVPAGKNAFPEEGGREWVSSILLGLKKEYRIYRNLHGTVLLQYNFFNQYFKTPYVDRLNSRMGFEYRLKKKKL